MAASKDVAEMVVNGVSMLRNNGLCIIISLVDILNNDIIIEYINIFPSLCYSELLSGWITNTNPCVGL